MSNHSLSVYSFKPNCLTDEVSIEPFSKQNSGQIGCKIWLLKQQINITLKFQCFSLFFDGFSEVLYSMTGTIVRDISHAISIMVVRHI